MLPPLQPCWAAAAACTSLWSRLAPSAIAYIATAGSKRGLASGTGAAAAAPAAASWRQRFEGVAPGSVLRVDLPESSVHLSVQVGEHEAVELSSNAAAGQLEAAQAPHEGHAGSSIVAVSQAQSGPATPQQPLQLLVKGPSRFLTVEAFTAGGSTAVEVVQEGSLRVATRGGNISVPKVKAFDAHLSSGGGAIRGNVTGVDVRLRSAGGPVQLKGLVGKRAEVDTGGGALALGACYADQLHIQSGGGPVHITNIDCRGGTAALRSSGGSVVVDSLDGNLTIDSEGGVVQAQLHDNAGSVSISSGGGDIQLFISPAVAGRLLLRNCARIAARPGTVRVALPQDDGSLALALPLGTSQAGAAGAAAADSTSGLPPLSRLQRSSREPQRQAEQQQQRQQLPPPGNAVTAAGREQAGGGAEIVLDAGGQGTVSIAERGWMEALRQRYGS